MKKIIISVDGPAASGKEKIAKYISKKWKYKHLDSGIIYRRLAYILLKNKTNLKSKSEIKKIINQNIQISFRKSKVLRSEKIRLMELFLHSLDQRQSLQYHFQLI